MSQNSAAVREKQKRLFSCGRLNGAFAVRPPFLKKQATPSPGRKELGRADAQAAKLLDIEGRGRKNAKGRPEVERVVKKKATMKNSLSLSLDTRALYLLLYIRSGRRSPRSRRFSTCKRIGRRKEGNRERKGTPHKMKPSRG